MGKDDPETAALKQELEDLINKCKVRVVCKLSSFASRDVDGRGWVTDRFAGEVWRTFLGGLFFG